jgi:restriction endonuclease S subunit
MTLRVSKGTALADLVDFVIGGLWGSPPTTAKPDEVDVIVVRAADFRNWDTQRALNAAPRRVPARSLERRMLEVGDLILEVSGGSPAQPVGRVLLVDEHTISESRKPLICSNFCRKLHLKPGVNPHFVKRQLDWLYQSGHTDKFQTSTTNIRNLKVGEFLQATTIFLPDPPLQDRMTALLDKIDAIRDSNTSHLDASRRLIERFRQSVLAAACSGRLTVDCRASHPSNEDSKDSDYPLGWTLMPVKEIFDIQNGRAFPSKQYSPSGIHLLRPGNLSKDGTVDWRSDNTVFLPLEWAERFPGYILGQGELVMNLTAQSLKDEFLGRVCIKGDAEPALLNQRIARFVNNRDYDVRPYALIYFKSRIFRHFVDGLDTGTLIRHMHSRQVEEHLVPLPPHDEQAEIIKRVDALLRFADQVDKSIQTASTRVRQSSQAVLAKAFHGGLPPLDAGLIPAAKGV